MDLLPGIRTPWIVVAIVVGLVAVIGFYAANPNRYGDAIGFSAAMTVVVPILRLTYYVEFRRDGLKIRRRKDSYIVDYREISAIEIVGRRVTLSAPRSILAFGRRQIHETISLDDAPVFLRELQRVIAIAKEHDASEFRGYTELTPAHRRFHFWSHA
ncbi:MAG TPA: hypothetical protein VIH21_02305 [Dehalococcoidia bacterium]